MNTQTEPDLHALVATLRRYHSSYKRLDRKRDRTPMSDRLRVWPTLQRQADTLCGKILRTERRIIEELLKQKPASEL